MQRCFRVLLAIVVLVTTTMLPAYAYHRGLAPADERGCAGSVNAGTGETCPHTLGHRDHCCHAYAHFLAAMAAVEPAELAHADHRRIILPTLMPRGVFLPPPTQPPDTAPD